MTASPATKRQRRNCLLKGASEVNSTTEANENIENVGHTSFYLAKLWMTFI